MNDPIKYMITGAAIAIVCGTLGAAGGVWVMKGVVNDKRVEARDPRLGAFHPAPFTYQPSASGTPSSGGNGQRMTGSQQMTIPPMMAGSSNVVFRPGAPTGRSQMSYSQFQMLQNLPEVKNAREAFLQAQKKYEDAVKAMVASGSGATAAGQERPEMKAAREELTVAQKKFSSVMKQAVENAQVPVAAAPKTTPLTIKIPPTGSTNGVVQGKGRM